MAKIQTAGLVLALCGCTMPAPAPERVTPVYLERHDTQIMSAELADYYRCASGVPVIQQLGGGYSRIKQAMTVRFSCK